MNEKNNVYNNLLELVGNTPLVKIDKITKRLKGNFFAKIDGANPGQSSKDRIALYIIENAEKKGIIKKGDTIIETTSGNTGFSDGAGSSAGNASMVAGLVAGAAQLPWCQ